MTILDPAVQAASASLVAAHKRVVKEKNRQISKLQASNGALQRALQEQPLTPSEALIERAEKAEMESGRAAEVAERWREAYDDLVSLRRTDQPRPLTADDITDEMADRFIAAYMAESGPLPGAIRAGLVAMHTPPPARPEGAEELKHPVIVGLAGMDSTRVHGLTQEDIEGLCDRLAERGVRVTGAES